MVSEMFLFLIAKWPKLKKLGWSCYAVGFPLEVMLSFMLFHMKVIVFSTTRLNNFRHQQKLVMHGFRNRV